MRLFSSYIWDFDGNIFDSYPHTTEAMMRVCAEYGIEAERHAVNKALRNSFATAFRLLGLNDEQIARFDSIMRDREMLPITVPFPQTFETLKALSDRGAKHYLYTHSDESMSVWYLKKYNMLHFFEECVTSDYGFPCKPSPDAINYLVEKHGLDRSDTVMVGDREIDVMSGIHAGVKTCLFDKDHLVAQTQADYRVEELLQIIKIEENETWA